jgi:hypothetical protein
VKAVAAQKVQVSKHAQAVEGSRERGCLIGGG